MRRALVFPRATDVTWRARIVRFCVHAKASELGRSRSCEAAHPARASLPSPLPFPTAPGSHFFQNILSFGIGYATVNSDEIADASDAGMEVADYSFFESLPTTPHEGKLVRHVQLDAPLEIVVDGISRRGVVMKPGKPFDLYVGQVDAFMALQETAYGSLS